jgi:hypothetical protein
VTRGPPQRCGGRRGFSDHTAQGFRSHTAERAGRTQRGSLDPYRGEAVQRSSGGHRRERRTQRGSPDHAAEAMQRFSGGSHRGGGTVRREKRSRNRLRLQLRNTRSLRAISTIAVQRCSPPHTAERQCKGFPESTAEAGRTQGFFRSHRRGGTDTEVFRIAPQRRDGPQRVFGSHRRGGTDHRGFSEPHRRGGTDRRGLSDHTAEAGRTAEAFQIAPQAGRMQR